MDKTVRNLLFNFFNSFISACGNGLLRIWQDRDPHLRSSYAAVMLLIRLMHNAFNNLISPVGKFSAL